MYITLEEQKERMHNLFFLLSTSLLLNSKLFLDSPTWMSLRDTDALQAESEMKKGNI